MNWYMAKGTQVHFVSLGSLCLAMRLVPTREMPGGNARSFLTKSVCKVSTTEEPPRETSATARWHNQGPPQHNHPGPTNSWLYVPLLDAGAGRLTQEAEEAWLHDPRSTREWHAVVQQLRQAQPVPWQQLHHTLVVLQDVAAATGGRLSPAEARLPATWRKQPHACHQQP